MVVETRKWRRSLEGDSKKKYKIKGGITQLRHKPTNSPMWNDLIKALSWWKIY
jgi:hypothetical protein